MTAGVLISRWAPFLCGDTEYDLPLDPEFAAILLDWKRQCPTTPETWVFPNPDTQRPYWPDSVCVKYIKLAAVKAELGREPPLKEFAQLCRSLELAIGSSSLKSEVNAFERVQIVQDRNSSSDLLPAELISDESIGWRDSGSM